MGELQDPVQSWKMAYEKLVNWVGSCLARPENPLERHPRHGGDVKLHHLYYLKAWIFFLVIYPVILWLDLTCGFKHDLYMFEYTAFIIEVL